MKDFNFKDCYFNYLYFLCQRQNKLSKMFSSNQSYIKPLCLIVCMSLMLMNASDAYEFCGTKSDFKWRRYPDTCNALYFCFLGKAVTFRCPPGQVVGADKRYCVPENSVFDDCKYFIQFNEFYYLIICMLQI